MRLVLLTLVLLGTVACGGEQAADTGLCADAPLVTWGSFGDAFLQENCRSCHAPNSANRYGAPESVTLDDKDTVLAQADLLLAVVSDGATMPPEGGVHEDDRWLFELWLTCSPY